MREHDESGAPDRDPDRIVIRGTGSAPDADDADDEETTEEIRVEIEQTRAEMSGTIDAIQEKLKPEALTEQAKEAAAHAVHDVKEAAWDATVGRVEDAVESAGETARGAGSTMMETIRQNPVPAALAGLSLGWLWMNRSRGSYARTTYYYSDRAGGTYPYRAGRTAHTPSASVRTATYGDYRGPEQDTGEGISDKVGEAANQVRETAGDVASRAGEVMSDAGEAAMDTGSDVMDVIRRNPLPAALTGLGLAWLFMNREDRPSGRTEYYQYRAGRTYPYGARGAAYGPRGRATMGTYVGDRGPEQDTGEGITDKVGEAASQVQERAGEMASRAGEMASDAVSGAAEMASSVGERAGDVGSDIFDVIRRNPVPAALTGIGLAWLYMNRESDRPPYVARSRDHVWSGSGVRRDYDYRGYDYRGGDQGQSTVGQMADQAQRRAGDLASGVADQAGEYADWAADQGEWAGRRAQRMVQDNPLMAGALAATVGSAVGLLLPETRTEDEVLGKARDSLVGQAQAVTQDTVEKVQRVADEVQSTAQKEARAEGLTT